MYIVSCLELKEQAALNKTVFIERIAGIKVRINKRGEQTLSAVTQEVSELTLSDNLRPHDVLVIDVASKALVFEVKDRLLFTSPTEVVA